MATDARVWRSPSWWRPVGQHWVAVESYPNGNQWTAPTRGAAVNGDLASIADQALTLSSGEPVATFSADGGRVYLFTREWGARCVRELVGDNSLAALPPPPLSVVLRPHPLGAAGIDDSIRMVKEGIENGRKNRLVIAWARQQIHAAGLGGARGAPDPSRIVEILFAAVKRELTFVKDPVNGEAMANAEHLLCLDRAGPCIPAGDCDEQLIVMGAALAAVGVPVRLIVRKYPGAPQGHITLAYDSNVRLGGPWRCLDPSTDSGACSNAPYTEEIVVDLVSVSDQPFIGLGDPGVATLGQAPATPAELPADQAAGWIAQLAGVQGMLARASSRLRQNAAAYTAVRADLGLPATDPAPAPEAPGAGGGALSTYIYTRAWTADAADAESKLLQTADFCSQCIGDALAGTRAMSLSGQDIYIAQAPGDPFSILLAPGPSGGAPVPTYYDAQGNATGTLGIPPLLIGAIVAAVSLAVAYVVGKVCDQLATAHHDDALNKISDTQAQLVASGQQSPEQARGMVAALTDLNKTEQPKPSALQDFLSTFPIIAVAGAALAGVAAGFGLSRFLGMLLPGRASARAPYYPRERWYRVRIDDPEESGTYTEKILARNKREAEKRALGSAHPGSKVIRSEYLGPEAAHYSARAPRESLGGFRVGDRVELHPGTDRWMRGDRYGDVVRVGRTRLHVHMDRSGQTITVSPGNVMHLSARAPARRPMRVARYRASRRRAHAMAPSADVRRYQVERVYLDRGGYDSSGRYFGRGAPLYSVYDAEERRYLYVRADSARRARHEAIGNARHWGGWR